MSSFSKTREKRLLYDFNEVTACPVERCTVQLLDDNLSVWHFSIFGENSSCWQDSVLHGTITFDKDYPLTAPKAKIFTYFKHLNCQRAPGNQYNICLDMLETPTSSSRPYENWSSAFSGRSILMQLASFLLTRDTGNSTAENIERTQRESLAFTCECGHTGLDPKLHPKFLQRLATTTPSSFPPIEVSGESALLLRSRLLQQKIQANSLTSQTSISTATVDKICPGTSSQAVSPTPTVDKIYPKTNLRISSVPNSCIPTSIAHTGEWQTVRSKRSTSSAFLPEANTKVACIDSLAVVVDANTFNALEKSFHRQWVSCCLCSRVLEVDQFSASQLRNGSEKSKKCRSCISAFPKKVEDVMSSAAAKNFARRERRRKKKSAKSALVEPGQKEAEKTREEEKFDETACKEQTDGFKESPKACEQDWKLVSKTKHVQDTNQEETTFTQEWAESSKNLGPFGLLSQITVTMGIMTYLETGDILNWGSTCKAAFVEIESWRIWKHKFQIEYPRSGLKATTNCAWKHAYMLEKNLLSDEPICFHSRLTRSETILGIPLIYTVNPKTKNVDYATSTFDIISYGSFSAGLRSTAWGEEFQEFLPLYFDQQHFKRSIKILRAVAVKLGPQPASDNGIPQRYRSPRRSPEANDKFPQTESEMIVHLLAKMMSTLVVLLCDKGVTASEKALTGYCQLHRLLLAVVDYFPVLQRSIRERIRGFVEDASKRVKSYTKSLGELLPLLTVCEHYGWKDMGLCYFFESLDRSILWACGKDASLACVKTGDSSRLQKHFDATRVSTRLMLFHSAFLKLVAQGGGKKGLIKQCGDRYDLFLGRPPLYMRKSFQNTVTKILNANSWEEFFDIADIAKPSESQLLKRLELAVGNSLKKGYHSKNTRFDRLMSSGVSRIMLKGESYSVSPNLQKIHMQEKWRFDGPTIYLDASCLIYSFDGKCLDIVDYGSTQSSAGCSNRAPWCVHSGDVIDGEQGMGLHTIDVHVKKIPSKIGTLVFTISAWTTPLSSIYQPSIHLSDAGTDTELCSYELEGKDTKDKTSVIMCTLSRETPTSRWQMQPIGEIGYGRAGTYDPIKKTIKDKILRV